MPTISFSSIGPGGWVLNAAVVAATLGTAWFLYRAPFASRDAWRATVTPLASIIGSGFLVVAPLLGATVGSFALFAMAGIVMLAYAVGGVIRYNIDRAEDIVEGDRPEGPVDISLVWMGRVAKLVLALAYVVAVAFYLELLGAFGLRLVGTQDPTLQKIVATVLVVLIGGFGMWRGLGMLEVLESRAVEIKLGVIAGLLLGLAVHNAGLAIDGEWNLPSVSTEWDTTTIRRLLGAFLIVQGFETSRYLRGEYPARLRISTMRRAQVVSGAVYLAFVALATVLLGRFDTISETGIIDLSAPVAFALPYLLVLGAAMSQFSAAVADTIGSGGLVEEGSRGRIGKRTTYGVVILLVGGLLWTTDILSVIAYASRAFAAFYAIQAVMGSVHAWSRGGRRRAIWYAALAIVMVLAAAFGIPAEAQSG